MLSPLKMSQSALNHRWTLVFTIFVLICGILLQNHVCKASGTTKKHKLKNILFLSAKEIQVNPGFPSDVIFEEENVTRLCFNIQTNQFNADCCDREDFICSTKIVQRSCSTYSLTVNKSILEKHDIVVLLNPMSNFSCMQSQVHNATDFILNLHNCLKPGGRNIRISLDHPYYNESKACQGEIKYMFKFGSNLTSYVKNIFCEPFCENQQLLNLTFQHPNNVMNLQEAVNIMNNFSYYKGKMGAFKTAFIKIGEVSGVIVEMPTHDQKKIALNFGFTSQGLVKILKENNHVDKDLDVQIQISKEASEEAVNRICKYVGVFLFPGMTHDVDGYFLNKTVLMLEMGENISNHLQLNIYFNNVNMRGISASCISWDKGDNQNWTTDNCQTSQVNGSVTCQCSYHAFFAIRKFPAENLTWITPEMIINETLSSPLNTSDAARIMNNLLPYFKKMEEKKKKVVSIEIDNITGVIAKIENISNDINFGFKPNGDIVEKNKGNKMTTIRIPLQAIKMAQSNGIKYIGVFRFPEMPENSKSGPLFNKEVIGIEMGENISSLSENISIHYTNVEKDTPEAVCISWDGADATNWTTDGCTTITTDKSITCECNHLTFFAVRILRIWEQKNEQGSTPGKGPEIKLSMSAPAGPPNSAQAANVMKNLSFILDNMGNASSAAIEMGNISGVISKLAKQNQASMDFGFTTTGDVKILEEKNNGFFARAVHFPKEASEMAVDRNGSFSGILRFPDIPKINSTSSFFNNEILGLEMGVNISNLSETIDIHFSNVNTTGFNVSCISWDGRSKDGGRDKWITDGCLTNEANGSITCQCSHLTFFAILMSGAEQISSSDFKALTQITKAGCGMSMFFLGVALFMHFLIRKTKATQAIKILMNLFVALFILNFCFLINDTIANLKISAACVVMAAAMHYSMLATFTWFFMQALHLYFNLYKIPTEMKYYMYKICIVGWVIPAVVVAGLLASSKYDYIEVSDDIETSVNMCWIPDSTIHLGVNIGYYSIVFIFTLTIFAVIVVQMRTFAPKEAKTKESTKKRVFSLLGLFCLLGITWGFAFFSYGPLLLPSHYMFTILNSFQGFFLFVYYYFSSRIVPEESKQTKSSNLTTQNVTTNPYG